MKCIFNALERSNMQPIFEITERCIDGLENGELSIEGLISIVNMMEAKQMVDKALIDQLSKDLTVSRANEQKAIDALYIVTNGERRMKEIDERRRKNGKK